LVIEDTVMTKKTNFDRYLDTQLQDPAFAARFKSAGDTWDVAIQLTTLRRQAGLSQKEPPDGKCVYQGREGRHFR